MANTGGGMSIEAIKQMVGVLASITGEPDRNLQQRPERYAKAREAIEAGRQAIAEAEKQERGEPVAWMGEMHGPRGGPWTAFIEHKPSLNVMDATTKWTPLYTTPQQRKPLTDEQADSIINGLRTCLHRDSKRQFLKTWLRDWAAHDIKGQA